MKTIHTICLSFILSFMLVGCTSSKTYMSSGFDFTGYKYVVIGKPDGNLIAAHSLDVRIGNLLEARGFSVIGDKQAETLSEPDQAKTLMVRFGMSSNDAEAVFSITLDDYVTGRALYASRGAYNMGWNSEGHRRGAIKKAIRQLEETLAAQRGNATAHPMNVAH